NKRTNILNGNVTIDGSSHNGKMGDFYLGLWGPGAAGKVACYSPEDGVNVYQESNPQQDQLYTNSNGLYIDATGNTLLKWYGSTGGSVESLQHLYRAFGGVPKSTVACSSREEFVGKLFFKYERFRNGIESAVGILPPFTFPTEILPNDPDYARSSTSFSRFVSFEYLSDGRIKLRWKYLPGADSVLDGVDLFYKLESSSNDRKDDFCKFAASWGYLQESVGKSVVEYITSFKISNPFSINTSLQLYLCPYRNVSVTSDAGTTEVKKDYIGEYLDPHLYYYYNSSVQR
ncbi:MAG: hypothetical protein HQK53_03815, partial [Oligoflexia bacterium]|nr:hypothetical protein [Oligoflexia bacterium]